MVSPEQSSQTTYNVRDAKNALDGDEDTIMHTENEKSGWWTAKFDGNQTYKITSVKFLNRPDGWGDRLGDAVVEVDGRECGTVQQETVQGVWYTVECATPLIGKSVKVTSKADTPLHVAEVRVFGEPFKQCFADECTNTQYLLQTGKCAECPADWIQDPNDKTNCIYGLAVKEIKCKRGHRVDQISVENYNGDLVYSHNGKAGGSWRNKDQIVKLAPGEYVTQVVGRHITAKKFRNQLRKVVYKTNTDRVIACVNKKIKYQTRRDVYIADEGMMITHVNQKEDARVCCGQIVNVDQLAIPPTMETALNNEFVATCNAN